MIPHFGYAEELNGHLIVIEYVPPETGLWSSENKVIFFRGKYQATVLLKIAGASFPDLKTATHWATQRASVPAQPPAQSSPPPSCSYCGRS